MTNAILFLYRDVLKCKLPWLDGVQRAKKPQRLPVVLTRDEMRAVLAQMQATTWLMAAALVRPSQASTPLLALSLLSSPALAFRTTTHSAE